MKFVKIIILILLAQLSLSKAAGQGVDYFNKGDIYQALQIAQQKQKFLLVEFHAPWNYKSQWQNKILNQDSVLYQYVNENFVAFKFDTQTKNGANFATQYSVTDYPAIFIFNTNGDVINRLAKAYDTKDLIELLSQTQLAKQGAYMWKINQIETQLKQQQIPKAQQLTNLLVKDLQTQIIATQYWETISNTTLNYYMSPAFQLITANLKLANDTFGQIEVESLLTEIINDEISSMLSNPKSFDSVKLKHIADDIKKINLTKPDLFLKIGMITDIHDNNVAGYIKKCGELCNIVNEDQIFITTLALSAITKKANNEERHKARQIVRLQMRQLTIPSQIHSLSVLLKALE